MWIINDIIWFKPNATPLLQTTRLAPSFIGVGTTAVAANQLKRKWIGIENNPEYVKIAKKRIKSKENL